MKEERGGKPSGWKRQRSRKGWLRVRQVAVKATILSSMKVIFEEKREGLMEKIAMREN